MKILMVGLGSIGQRHLRNLRRMAGGEELEILAYRHRGLGMTLSDDMQVRPGVVLEEEYNVKPYHDFYEALERKPDVTFVTNVTSQHMRYALCAAEAGSDLFIEKPISDTLAGVGELNRLIRANGIVAYVGFQNRHHPGVRRLRQALRDGELGEIIHLECEYGEQLATMHSYEDYRSTYMARSDLGGGPILNLLIHDLDLVQWLFGVPERVHAVGGGSSGLEIDTEGCASALFEYPRSHEGTLALYAHTDFSQTPACHRIKVVGTCGKAELDLGASRLTTVSKNGLESAAFDGFVRNDMFVHELEEFFESVRSRTLSGPSVKEATNSLRMALAMKEALRTGDVVYLGAIG